MSNKENRETSVSNRVGKEGRQRSSMTAQVISASKRRFALEALEAGKAVRTVLTLQIRAMKTPAG